MARELLHWNTRPSGGGTGTVAAFVPPCPPPAAGFPLIVFLHGLGERGADGLCHLGVGLPAIVRRDPARFPAVVLAPQCPPDAVWTEIDEAWAEPYRGAEDHIAAALDEALERLPVDPRRVALTGLSMGGYGAIAFGAVHADRLRAMVAVCGGGDDATAAGLVGLPVWLLHGARDPLVPASYSRRLAAAIRRLGGDVRHTEYPDLEHNAWDRAYADPEVQAFLIGSAAEDAP